MKIYPNLSNFNRQKNRRPDMNLDKPNSVSMRALIIDSHLSFPVDSSILQVVSMLDSPQNDKITTKRKYELKYLQTAILSSQFNS